MPFTYSNIKQKSSLSDFCTPQFCTCANADMYVTFKSLCVFREGGQVLVKTGGPGDPVSQSSASRTASRLLAEMV